jgi:DNA-directed RNA polymerase specialized sigma24 family protein
MVWHSGCFSEYCEGEKTEGDNVRPVRRREGKGMKSALKFHSNQFRLTEEDTYATTDDFQKLFAREMSNLFRLSLRLTADAAKAESCLILAMRECFANNNVSKEWALIWARRTVIRNAIRLVLETENAMPNDICSKAGPDSHLHPSEYRIEALRDSLAVLELPDFDRLVFVICALERYSILDCALLLKRSPKDVNDARVRAINQVVSAEERYRHDSTKHCQPACTAPAAME